LLSTTTLPREVWRTLSPALLADAGEPDCDEELELP
jgi:hypothetical protein